MTRVRRIAPSRAVVGAALLLFTAGWARGEAPSQTSEIAQSAPAASAADAALRARVTSRLADDPDARKHSLTVEVRDGIAYLRGELPHLKAREDVMLAASVVRGLLGLRDETVIPRFEGGDARLAEVVMERVNQALRSVRVRASVERGVATLSGRVRTTSERALARNAAVAVEGLQGLDNQIAALSDGDLDDTRMRVRVLELIENRRQYPIEGDIAVEVENGVVTLSGQVPRVFDRFIAEKVVGIVSGVKALRDEIEVVPARGSNVTRTVPVRPDP